MRTTLTIDDELAGILKHQAREMGKPLKEIVNTALRRGLVDNLGENTQPISVRPHDFGASRPGLDLGRLNQFVDELEVEDYLKKAHQDDTTGR